MIRRLRPWALALALGFLCVSHLWGQSQATTGLIEGVVLDPQGATRAGALVGLKNTAIGFTQNVVTDANGRFRALQLPLGPYQITVSVEGFATLVREGVTLSVGQTISLTLRLEVAGVAQEVRVTAEAPLIETAATDDTTRFDEKEVQGLPNFNHNFLNYTKLTPGVAVVQSPDGEEITMNGQLGISNNVSVDGADFNNPFFGEQRGGQRPPFTFNLDAVQEMVVLADGANAEFGRSAGGFVNVITKSGANAIHGSAHGYYTSESLSAKAPQPDGTFEPKPEGDRYQTGFTFGGPVLQDKFFYFLSADYQNGNQTKQLDPLRIEPRVVDAFAALGSPDENGSILRGDDAFVALIKTDWHVNEQNLATLRFNYTWADQPNGTFDVDSWGVSANAVEKVFSKAISGSVLSTLSASLANEFRFQFAREDRPRPYDGPITPLTGRPLPDTAFDFVQGYRFGMPFFIPVDYHDDRTQFVENVTYYKGAHTFKAGVEFNRTVSSQTFRGFANGIWKFSSTDGFLNYLNNPNYVECTGGATSQNGTCPAGATVTGPVIFYLQQAGVGGLTVDEAGTQSIPQEEWGVFVQDTWQPMSNLTINIGLRWEAQLEPDPITPPEEVFFSDFIGTTRNGQAFLSDGTIPSDTNMWEPRVGVAWDATKDGKTLVRANFGIYYARVPGLNVASTRSTNGSIGQSIYRDSTFRNFGGPLPPAYPNILPPSETGGIPNHPSVYTFDSDFQNARTTQFAIGGQRELLPDLAVELRYNYAAADHLTRFVDRNAAELGSPWSTGLGEDGTNGVATLWSVESTARSRYWGLTLAVNKRFSDCFGVQFNYTYSQDRSDDDNQRDPFTLRYALIHEDPNNPLSEFSQEYSWSDRDQRHRLNAWMLWVAPLEINFNARYSYQSPQPLSITAAGLPAATPQDRINRNPDGSLASVTQRNLGRKDNQLSMFDLRLSRVFTFSALSVEPIIDIFNVFNAENFLQPQVTNLVFNFDGTVRSGAGEPRRLQFGLRLLF